MSARSSLLSGSVAESDGGRGSTSARTGRQYAPQSRDARRPRREIDGGEGAGGAGAASALVVFADHADCPWLRPLRRGFRHCFVVLRAGSVWLACDPLKDRIELDALDLPGSFDLAAFYCEQGYRVLVGERPPPRMRRHFALAPLTCVTVVKRLLGIDAPWVWTPWQLYIHLSGSQSGFRKRSSATRLDGRTIIESRKSNS